MLSETGNIYKNVKKKKFKKNNFRKKIRKKICQIFAVEYFPFNPSKYDVWNHCQVQGGVATSSTSEEHCNLLKSIKLFS